MFAVLARVIPRTYHEFFVFLLDFICSVLLHFPQAFARNDSFKLSGLLVQCYDVDCNSGQISVRYADGKPNMTALSKTVVLA